MRVKLAHGAAIAATILGLTGCSSGPGGSGRTWYGAKTKSSAPAFSNAPPGPQLPSSAVAPPGTNAAPSYASVPPGAPAGTADQPASYAATNAAMQGAPSGSYGSNASYGAPAVATPQSGPYSSVYGQGTAPGAVAATPVAYPSTNYPATGVPADPYAAGAATGGNAYAGAPAGIHTADASASPGYGGGANNNMPASSAPTSASGYQYPDPARAVDQTGAAPYGGGAAAAAPGAYGAPAAYPTTGAAGAYPPQGGAAPAQGAAYPATGYPTTGSTSGDTYPQTNYSQSDAPWQPGNTGFNPAGAPAYQNTVPPATTAPANSDRRDPNWRPGSTSDFSPSRNARGGSAVMSAGYDAPIGTSAAAGAANPYAAGSAAVPYGAGSSAAAPAATTPAYGAPAYGTPAANSVPPRGY